MLRKIKSVYCAIVLVLVFPFMIMETVIRANSFSKAIGIWKSYWKINVCGDAQ